MRSDSAAFSLIIRHFSPSASNDADLRSCGDDFEAALRRRGCAVRGRGRAGRPLVGMKNCNNVSQIGCFHGAAQRRDHALSRRKLDHQNFSLN